MGIFDASEVITVYSLKQAIEDGVLVEILKNRWGELSGGKPIVATAHLFEDVSLAALQEIWNEFVHWKRHIEKTLPEEEKLFHTKMNRFDGVGDRGRCRLHPDVSGGLLICRILRPPERGCPLPDGRSGRLMR